jgi:hypothetical protein
LEIGPDYLSLAWLFFDYIFLIDKVALRLLTYTGDWAFCGGLPNKKDSSYAKKKKDKGSSAF